MVNEVIILTETRRKILANRGNRSTAPGKVFSLDTLSSNAEILVNYGGQAALVFRAIVGSYWMSKPEHRDTGFKIHTAFRKAINLPDRQLQRATKKLEEAGYIERIIQSGHKTRLRLTDKGKQALAKTPVT